MADCGGYCKVIVEASLDSEELAVIFIVAAVRTSSLTNTLSGLSPRANYTDRTTATCRRS
jgi:hypothetical protein